MGLSIKTPPSSRRSALVSGIPAICIARGIYLQQLPFESYSLMHRVLLQLRTPKTVRTSMRTKRRRQKPAASRQRQSSMETRRQRQRTRVRQQKPPLQPTPQSRLQRESPRMWLKRAASTSSTGATAAMLAVLCCIPCSAAVLLPYCVLAHVYLKLMRRHLCAALL